MSIVDILILAILAIGFISGLQKGLIASILSLLAAIASSLVASALYHPLAEGLANTTFISEWLPKNLDEGMKFDPNTVSAVAGYVVTFFLVFAAFMLIVNLINNVFRLPKLRVADGLLGGVLGVIVSCLMVCVVVSTIRVILSPLSGLAEELLDESALGSFFSKGAGDLLGIGKNIEGLR